MFICNLNTFSCSVAAQTASINYYLLKKKKKSLNATFILKWQPDIDFQPSRRTLLSRGCSVMRLRPFARMQHKMKI